MQMLIYRTSTDRHRCTLRQCEGELEVTEVLLWRGAAVDSRSRDAWTPLMATSRYGHLDVVRLLLQNGAAVDSVTTRLDAIDVGISIWTGPINMVPVEHS